MVPFMDLGGFCGESRGWLFRSNKTTIRWQDNKWKLNYFGLENERDFQIILLRLQKKY